MLYLIATPIGNLADISYRAVQTLSRCDYILCEDTRTSLRLLQHYQIHKPLHSFHQFNESAKESLVIEDLKKGMDIALISDAGTPGVSDPGEKLAARCRLEQLPMTVIPGPCAAIAALNLSAFEAKTFQFIGFLPKKTAELKRALQGILHYPGTTICYESPHRIEKTLEELAELAAERPLCVARELTKIHEECLHGSAAELLQAFSLHPPKGEMVLLIGGETLQADFSALTPKEHVLMLQSEYGLSKKDAVKTAASLRKVPKNSIYKEVWDE